MLSVPAIIFGATLDMTALLVVGIIFAVHRFNGLVFWWTYTANLKNDMLLLSLIENQNYYEVKDLASQLGKQPEEVSNNIKKLIQKISHKIFF